MNVFVSSAAIQGFTERCYKPPSHQGRRMELHQTVHPVSHRRVVSKSEPGLPCQRASGRAVTLMRRKAGTLCGYLVVGPLYFRNRPQLSVALQLDRGRGPSRNGTLLPLRKPETDSNRTLHSPPCVSSRNESCFRCSICDYLYHGGP